MSSPQPLLIAYARISDLSGKRQTLAAALGVEAQHAACQSMARDAGAIVTKQYTDNDRSASRGENRPGFESMLADLHRGRTGDDEPVQGVITVDIDRIYKTPVQWERFVTAFRAAPGRVFVDWQGRRDLYASDADEEGLHEVSADGLLGAHHQPVRVGGGPQAVLTTPPGPRRPELGQRRTHPAQVPAIRLPPLRPGGGRAALQVRHVRLRYQDRSIYLPVRMPPEE
ncbi:recombinase family protein [Actinomadura latina]|uniref:Recombinase family protein n=1 Tax=Actinomadura latina TaxID=163603 RepID=A0A846Z8G9_9ACTN|nr:recombinase family protein [Actinomadura latina]NKZ06366.1 recombinase family protein [Actinomadura latina]